MKKLLLTTMVLLAMSSVLTVSAYACSMAPIDVTQAAKDLERFAAPALNIKAENITAIETSDTSANYVWMHSRMCPDGFAAKATFTVSYNNPADRLSKGCLGVVTVSMADPFGAGSFEIKHEYKVEIVQPGTCLE